ncbi:hypothetical protein VTH06DRAFT_8082 [Thermothelomyces fergusii]
MTAGVDIPTFARTQLSLLAAELEAEIAESATLVSLHSPAALQRAGVALANLTVAAQRTGLGGRTVLELAPHPATCPPLPPPPPPPPPPTPQACPSTASASATSAKAKAAEEGEGSGVKGVVTRVAKAAVAVALDDDGGDDGGGGKEDRVDALAVGEKKVWIVKVADDVTFRRMNSAMERLAKMEEREYSEKTRSGSR